ncbi:hypothetical protein [Pelagicoccus sp. SDUM812003]|uniref:hypothetical protein n=1 Tax=Pelagicoccus sp. SDUM812003 TaxID=3041267 RepID=UPI0028114D71|nr:hypothetical protein [Pelagicoccus sp. SDUM812003]
MFPSASGGPSADRLKELSARLCVASERLAAYSRQSEGEFASLARGTGELFARIEAMRERARSLDGLVRGTGEDHALCSAFQLYKSASDLVQSSLGFGNFAARELELVDPVLRECCSHQRECQNVVMHFSILGTGFRIESAYLAPEDQAVFDGVASDIVATQRRLGRMTEEVFGKLKSSLSCLVNDRKRTEKVHRELECDIVLSAQAIRKELDGTSEALAPAGELSERIVAHSDRGPAMVGSVVEALQMDDVVRQKLEHVCKNLSELSELLASSSMKKGKQRKEDLAYVNVSARVQLEQLRQARREIGEAGKTVLGGVRSLMDLGGELIESLTELQERVASSLDNCETARLFSREIEKIGEIARSCSEINQRIARLTDEIVEIIDSFSRDILKQNFDIKVVALNAQVSASRSLGGRTMERLAAETANLASKNESMTSSMLSTLSDLPSRLMKLQEDSQRFLELAGRDQEALSEDSSLVTQRLESMDDHILSEARSMGREFEGLRRETDALLSSLTFPNLVEDVFEKAEETCSVLIELTGRFAREADAQAVESRVESLKQSYTMKREVVAHESALLAESEDASPKKRYSEKEYVNPVSDSQKDATSRIENLAVVSLAAQGESDDDGIELF